MVTNVTLQNINIKIIIRKELFCVFTNVWMTRFYSISILWYESSSENQYEFKFY